MDELKACSDTSDAVPFYQHRGLFLKPVATLNISIQFPSLKLTGQSISTKLLLDSIRRWAAPDEFCSLRILTSTIEFIRFVGEIDNRSKLQSVLNRLDGKLIKLPNFTEQLKVRASVAKPDFPTRHDWDTFFREAKNMNEMKPGERPDTVYLCNLPCKWFSSKSKRDTPSASFLWKAFEHFGDVRAIDIPCIDPYRNHIKPHISGLRTFSFSEGAVFEAFVQFKDYISFVRAMDSFRGMKLMKKEGEKAYVANVKVDFDKTKHLSDYSIRKRRIEREKLIAEFEKEETLLGEKCSKENGRKKTCLEISSFKNVVKGNAGKESLKSEGNQLINAQRKLESVRLLSELFKLIKEDKEQLKTHEKYKKSKKKEKISKESPTQSSKNNLKSSTKGKSGSSDNYSDIISESDDDCLDPKEPLVLQGFDWPCGENFDKGGVWRERSNRSGGRKWHPNNSRMFSRQGKISGVPPHAFSNATQNLYYKYFHRISRLSHSRSRSPKPAHNNESSSSSVSKSSRKSKSDPYSNKRLRSRSRSRSKKGRKTRTRSNTPQRGSKHSKRSKRTRWGSPITGGKDSVQPNRKITGLRSRSKSPERCSSLTHTWSRSPSDDRECSWERDREDSSNFKRKRSDKYKKK